MKYVFAIAISLMLAIPSVHAGTFGSPAEIITMNGPGMGAFVQKPSTGTTLTTTQVPRQQQPCFPRPVPNQRWIPAHYAIVYQQIWIPPRWVERWVPPYYETQIIRGQAIPVLVQAGYYERVIVPGYYDVAPVQIWVQGQWVCG